MANLELQRLATALRHDPLLREELRARAHDPDALLAWSREKGYALARRDLIGLVDSVDELSDDELEQAAGGEDPWNPKP